MPATGLERWLSGQSAGHTSTETVRLGVQIPGNLVNAEWVWCSAYDPTREDRERNSPEQAGQQD